MDVRACADEQQEDEEERLEVEEGRLRELVRACCLIGNSREHTILATNGGSVSWRIIGVDFVRGRQLVVAEVEAARAGKLV